MTRTVGSRERTEIVLDPAEALRRGFILDNMLRGALPARRHGVVRATHSRLNELDDRRQLEAARRIHRASHG